MSSKLARAWLKRNRRYRRCCWDCGKPTTSCASSSDRRLRTWCRVLKTAPFRSHRWKLRWAFQRTCSAGVPMFASTREVAAQSAQIGVAEADLYPRLGVSGFIGYTSDDIRTLFAENSLTGFILPNFQWKILNYGRIINNIHSQEAKLQQRIYEYQSKVLNAGREVEDALAGYLQYEAQARRLEESVKASERSVELVLALYKEGRVTSIVSSQLNRPW